MYIGIGSFEDEKNPAGSQGGCNEDGVQYNY